MRYWENIGEDDDDKGSHILKVEDKILECALDRREYYKNKATNGHVEIEMKNIMKEFGDKELLPVSPDRGITNLRNTVTKFLQEYLEKDLGELWETENKQKACEVEEEK